MKYKKRLVLWCSCLRAGTHRQAGVLALVLWIFLTGVSSARDIEDILKRAREKYHKFREVATDITMVRTFIVEGKVVTKERIYKKGEMFRIEMDKDDITYISIYDGESFWMVIPERGVRRRGMQGRRGSVSEWFDFFGEELLRVDRLERLGRRDCYVLAGRDNLFLWIDRRTLTLLKIETMRDEKRGVMTFSDFEVIEGWEIPLTATMYESGRMVGSSSLRLDLRTVHPAELFNAEGIKIGDPPPCPFEQP